MSEIKNSSALPLETGGQHWNDMYLVTPDPQIPWRNKPETLHDTGAAREHYSTLWEQQQALLEIADAKLSGRDPSVELSDLAGLKLPNKVLKSNYSLVSELYRRLGPHNEMAGFDIMATSLASLVADEVLPRAEKPFEQKTSDVRSDVYIDAVERLSAFTEIMHHTPGRTAGKERELLLIAELLSEAKRAPRPTRNYNTGYQDFAGQTFDSDFYGKTVVEICDAISQNLASELKTTELGTSHRAQLKHKDNLSIIESAVLTKYDAIFDNITATTSENVATSRLAEFANEVKKVISKVEPGYGYELFAPLMYRYNAWLQGNLATSRVWHAPIRSDLPRDGFGYHLHPSIGEIALVTSDLKKQSFDMIVGQANETDDTLSHSLTARYQLKARSDASSLADEYDDKIISIHSADAEWLIAYAEKQLEDSRNGHSDLSSEEKLRSTSLLVRQLFANLVDEIGARIEGNSSSSQKLFFNGLVLEVPVSKLLDNLMPFYRSLPHIKLDEGNDIAQLI